MGIRKQILRAKNKAKHMSSHQKRREISCNYKNKSMDITGTHFNTTNSTAARTKYQSTYKLFIIKI